MYKENRRRAQLELCQYFAHSAPLSMIESRYPHALDNCYQTIGVVVTTVVACRLSLVQCYQCHFIISLALGIELERGVEESWDGWKGIDQFILKNSNKKNQKECERDAFSLLFQMPRNSIKSRFSVGKEKNKNWSPTSKIQVNGKIASTR